MCKLKNYICNKQNRECLSDGGDEVFSELLHWAGTIFLDLSERSWNNPAIHKSNSKDKIHFQIPQSVWKASEERWALATERLVGLIPQFGPPLTCTLSEMKLVNDAFPNVSNLGRELSVSALICRRNASRGKNKQTKNQWKWSYPLFFSFQVVTVCHSCLDE